MKLLPCWLALALALGAGACGDDDESAGAPDADPEIAQRSGYQSDYETSAAFFTRTESFIDDGSTHRYVRIWYSSDLEAYDGSEPLTAPVGATAIKQSTTGPGDDVRTVYVMTKQEPGYDPDHGDWFYEQRSADGETVEVSGSLQGCFSCHGSDGGADTDYLRGLHLESAP